MHGIAFLVLVFQKTICKWCHWNIVHVLAVNAWNYIDNWQHKTNNYGKLLSCTPYHHHSELEEKVCNQWKKTMTVSGKRRRLWLENLNQDFNDKNMKNTGVHLDHFITSKLQLFLYIDLSPMLCLILSKFHSVVWLTSPALKWLV